jgi:hypothetical protein
MIKTHFYRYVTFNLKPMCNVVSEMFIEFANGRDTFSSRVHTCGQAMSLEGLDQYVLV